MEKSLKEKITEELKELKAEAERGLSEIPEEFESLEDSEDYQYFAGQFDTVNRILRLLGKSDEHPEQEAEQPEIFCVAGYYEFDIHYGDKIIFTIDDPTETIFAHKDKITVDDMREFARDVCDDIDKVKNRKTEVENAIVEALCAHYKEQNRNKTEE